MIDAKIYNVGETLRNKFLYFVILACPESFFVFRLTTIRREVIINNQS
jgi:hypothetical protein